MGILEDSRLTGEVTFEQLAYAVGATFQCFDDAGVVYRTVEAYEDALMPEYPYEFQGPPEGNPVADACIDENSIYVEHAYSIQPQVIELQDVRIEEHRDEIIACYLEIGIEISEDATADEIRQARFSLTEDEYWALHESGRPTPGECVINATRLPWF
ncbi:MAG: hypothetical protein MUP36_02235 [Demequinaceae bacterium]|nr:hypothetical protein [Demequinaceae bacterium]